VAVSDQDSRGVAMPRAVLLGGLDEPLDLAADGCSSPGPPDIAGGSAGDPSADDDVLKTEEG
jgi:hypothetical protein